jgi:hypothetical protein
MPQIVNGVVSVTRTRPVSVHTRSPRRIRMTGGVTAGIDFSFALIGLLAGEETASLVQLLCE